MKTKMFVQFIIAVILLAGAVAAQKRANIGPCKLLSQTDAEKILGVKVKLKSEGRTANEMNCYYAPDDEKTGVSLILRVYPARKAARAFFRSNQKLHANLCNGFKLVSNAGERAWMCGNDNFSRDIAVLKNNFMFQLSITSENVSTAELKRIAQRLAAKL